jgi:hypothetical protein
LGHLPRRHGSCNRKRQRAPLPTTAKNGSRRERRRKLGEIAMLEPTLLLIALIVLASLIGASSVAAGVSLVLKLMFVFVLLMFVASVAVTLLLFFGERGGSDRHRVEA